MKQLQRFVGVVVKINRSNSCGNPPWFRQETHNDVNKTIIRVKHLLWQFAERADQFITVNSGHEDTRLSEHSSRI